MSEGWTFFGVRPSFLNSRGTRRCSLLLKSPIGFESSAAELFIFARAFLRGVLAFWVAEFGGQDRLAPAFWVMLGHVRFGPHTYATLRMVESSEGSAPCRNLRVLKLRCRPISMSASRNSRPRKA